MGGSETSDSDKGDEKTPETKGKIQRSVKSMIKQMQLSDNEMKYRMDNFDNVDVVKEYLKYLKCTKCNTNFQQVIKKGDSVGIHPLLGVLMCDSCCDYYGDGNFSLDSEGEDKYCRWCGEGGTIFACSKCICGFCDMCIKKHFGEEGLEAVEKDDDWICYFCNPQPLWYLRSICSLAKEAAKSKRENMKKGKDVHFRKKRRKVVKLENDLSGLSSDSSASSNSSDETPYKTRRKRKILKKVTQKARSDESSSEDEKENHVNSKKRSGRNRKQALGRDEDEDSSVADTKKKSKVTEEESELDNKTKLILEKLKSIWKLTQTITEVGLSSSRDKLKSLSKSKHNTLDRLKKEHEDLKSCMKVLVSSLNTASNSVNSINEDLTFNTTKDDTESFRSQEIRLKRLAEKFHEESDDHTSVDSEGDSFRKEIKKKEGGKTEKGTRKSDTVKKGTRKSDKIAEEEKNSAGGNISISLFSGSGSDNEEEEKNSVKEEEKRNEKEGSDKSDKGDVVKPLLKVKSFARMLDENVYDKNKAKEKTPIVIDLDMDSDEGEGKKKDSPNGKLNNTANGVSSEGEKKSPRTRQSKVPKNQTDWSEKEETEAKTKKRGKKKNADSEKEEETKRRSTRSRNKNNKQKSDESGNESSGSENRKASGKKKKKENCATSHDDKENSSGCEKSKSSDDEKEKEKEEKSPKVKEQPTESNTQSKNTTESEDKCEKKLSGDEKSDKEESSEGETDNNKEFNATTDGDDNEDDGERQKKKHSEDENEKSGEESKDCTSQENAEKGEASSSSDNENSKDSSNSEGENSPAKENAKNKSSDNENSKKDSSSSEGENSPAKENAKNKKESKSSDNESSKKDSSSSEGENSPAKENAKNKKESKSSDNESSKKDSSSSEGENSPAKENLEKKKANKSSDNEKDSKKDISSSEAEEQKKSEDKKSDSSDGDKSSADEEMSVKRRRHQDKSVKVSFEKFKRKRERFLKSSKENSEPEKESEKPKVTKELDSSESDGEKKNDRNSGKKKKKRRIVASSDEEDGEAGEKTNGATSSSEESEKENQKSEEDEVKLGSESSSEEEMKTKKRRRIRKRRKGSSDSSEEENKKKKRRDSSSDSSGDEKPDKKKKGRKNIKKILKKDSLEVETKEALKNEEERKKRLKERQKLFEELFPQDGQEEKKKTLILDFDPETKEPLVSVHKKLIKHLKPHQKKGVKFMWDNCFESVEKLEEDSGSGCILAHCMGLGKTLQVVTLVHTVMTHDLGVNCVLVVCPLSTVSNWIREFEMWLEKVNTDPITLYDLVKYRRPEERLFYLEDWHENGGVMVLSYDLFRNLTKVAPNTGKKGGKKKRKNQPRFEKALIDPGPDLVICDEGHLLKNEETALSKCVSRMKTSRRIVLTGTPLQNNLIEYHCMVQFVKPNILGTKKEFCNRFVNPINNGQFEDSTELDVKIMKKRSHVLHSMLDGCIQRFDYSVLTPFLPEKHEYVLSIALTDTQMKVYSHFLQNFSARVEGGSKSATLFNDYHQLQRIWTHPRTMLMQSEKSEAQKELNSDSEGSLKDFVVKSSEESETPDSSDDSVEEVAPRKRFLRSNANDPREEEEEEEKSVKKHWWDEFYDEKAYDDLRESNKLIILFTLLKHCAEKRDKLLVFSHSLYSLDLIEYFLTKIDENKKKDDETLCGHQDNWILGTDYFRLDGSTSSEMRDRWCKAFNKESNTRSRLFLISTKAGGLGINLFAANRVVLFDASWNPSHDLQSIFRVYRFGQKKACFVYRFLSEATMEEKIYERQVTKLSLAHRVVDEHQIGRHYTMGNLQELYAFQPTPKEERKVPNLPKDEVLADILTEHKDIVVGYHEHDSLLENKQEEELTEEERKAAWKEYEDEKTQKTFQNIAEQQMMYMQQGQQFVQEGPMMQQFINPMALNAAAFSQMNAGVNLMQSNIPLEFLERGVRLGVTPMPNESLDSYVVRILNKEVWVKERTAQGQ